MVATASSAGIDPYIMTIAPRRSAKYARQVSAINNRIRSIAARRGVALFDVHNLLLTGSCDGVQPIPCIGGDGAHPTEQGYRLIAEELERILVARYDVERSQ
jgi:lysophospholipase L1-like esterase